MDTSALALTTLALPTDAAQTLPSDTTAAGIETIDFATQLEQQIAQGIPALLLPAQAEVDSAQPTDGEQPQIAAESGATADGIIALISAPLMLQAAAPQASTETAAAAVPTGRAEPRVAGAVEPRVAGAVEPRAAGAVEPRLAGAAEPRVAETAPGERTAIIPEDTPAVTREATRAAAFEAFVAREARSETRGGEADRAPTALQPLDLPPMTAPASHASIAPATHATAQAAAHTERQVQAPVGSAGWSDGFAQQVTLIVKDGEQSAQLRLDPPNLGPLEVRLSIAPDRDGVAHAQFVSAHAAVREAIEAALPQLRAVLADSGITLGQASVGEGFVRDDARDGSQGGAPRGGGEARTGDPLAPAAADSRLVRHGLVDTFA